MIFGTESSHRGICAATVVENSRAPKDPPPAFDRALQKKS
jgi:hypothetical protein